MTTRKLQARILSQLFVLTAATETPSVRRLADALGASLAEVANALSSLHDAGLVDATRLRLTLPGLTVAVALQPARPALRLAA